MAKSIGRVGGREVTDVGRVTVILDAIAESRGPLTLSELACRTGLPRSTVHRTIQTLERELYVIRLDNQPGYALGPGLLKFGMNAHLRLLGANRAQLVRLAQAVNENVDLAVFSGREVVVVDQVASPKRLKGVTKIGKSFSLHASCIGKALLAQLSADRFAELVRPPLQRLTDNTVVDPDLLRAEVDDIRRLQVAVDIEEHNVGICAVATAMTGPSGALQAIAIVIPTQRFNAKKERAVELLHEVNHRVDVDAVREHFRAT